MLQILYNILQNNKEKVLNSDTVPMKIVNRGLGNFLLCCLMHSLYLTYFGRLLECGGNSVTFPDAFINSVCWGTGVHIYGNKTKMSSLYWNWDYEPVHQNFYPAISGKSYAAEEKIYLTQISKIPMFFMLTLATTLFGKLCWSYLMGSFLHDLVSPLDSANKEKTVRQVLTQDDKESLLDDAVQVFVHHLRFYNELVIYYILCLFLNALALSWQLYTIIDVVGGKDPVFGLKVFYFTFLEYLKWPIELLGIFPSIAICHYRSVGAGSKVETLDFICSLPWSESYLLLFASISILLAICFVVTLFSLFYYLCFLTCSQNAKYELTNTLKLHEKSKAFNTLNYLNSGGIFMLILLTKNVQYNQVCQILERTWDEISLNRRKFNEINKGIL